MPPGSASYSCATEGWRRLGSPRQGRSGGCGSKMFSDIPVPFRSISTVDRAIMPSKNIFLTSRIIGVINGLQM